MKKSLIEKADENIDGAYAMVNREFARYIRDKYPKIRFFNREEDMGLENLRAAKLSERTAEGRFRGIRKKDN